MKQSENKGEWITSLVRDYYQVDGQSLGERNPRGLQDDYVKFIRFAQWKIDKTGRGILAFINNHGFLDNPTFRGMRQQLAQSFDFLCIYDLHGNSKKQEKQLDGSPDINVFDIQQGVSITLGVKGVKSHISHCHLYGSREEKYKLLANSHIKNTRWEEINPQSPFYFFILQTLCLLNEYEKSLKITEIFLINSTGIVTARDNFALQYQREKMWDIIQDFINIPVESARLKYDLGEDVRDWKVHLAQADIRTSGIDNKKIVPVLYRPFDVRYTYYTGKSRGFHCTPRGEVMRNMLTNNIAFLTSRMTKGEQFAHVLVTNFISEKILLSAKTSNNSFHFPLYLYSFNNNDKQLLLNEQRHPNLSPEFLKDITSKFGYTPTPEEIFYYIYAIFHSPTYRTRYAEFLKIDFPRVPLTSNKKLFTQLSKYGEELVALHLMKSAKLDNLITKFVESSGDCLVDAGHPKYINGAVVINKKGDKFTDVPESVWNFYVGGYQVCQKWLKDRKGRQLSNEDILHYQRIVVSLKETIALMQKIDEAIPSFPIQ